MTSRGKQPKMQNVLWYVVNTTHRIRHGLGDPKNLTSPKIISLITPVIYVIMSLTVNSVKMAFFDNVVSAKGAIQ